MAESQPGGMDPIAPTESGGIGTRLGPYVLQAKLGEGGMGTVFRALDTNLKTPVAIKVIRPNLLGQGEITERFFREARAAASIDVPEVVRVKFLGQERGVHFLVMELVEGESLEKTITREGPMAPRLAASITLAVARALRAAHQKGIVHRDVKPPNILLGSAGQERVVKLGDLGLVKVPADGSGAQMTGSGVGMGTPGYMPPEQYAGAADVDQRADIFSLGVTLYQMLTGRLPFSGKTPFEILEKVMHTPPDPLPDSSRKLLGSIVERMLQKQARDRYQNCDEVIADLSRAVGMNDGSSERPEAAQAHAGGGARKVAIAIALGIVVVVAAGLTVYLVRGGGGSTGARPAPPSPVPPGELAPESVAAPRQPSPRPPSPDPSGPRSVHAAAVAADVEATLNLAYSTERAGAAPSAAVSILGRRGDASGADWRTLSDGESLSSADAYRILARPETSAFFYVFQVDSQGKLDVLFPRLPGARFATGRNPLPPGAWASIPAGGEDAIQLDNHLGVEHLYVVATAEPWPELERSLAHATKTVSKRVVEAPFGLRTRGVGGLTRVALPSSSADIDERKAEKVELMVTGAKGVLVVERWFKHVARPR